MKKPKPKVGDIVFIYNGEKRFYKHENAKLKTAVISRVGNKFFFVKEEGMYFEYKFFLSNWNDGEWMGRRLYKNESEYYDELDAERIRKRIYSEVWSKTKIPIEKLREVEKILFTDPE